MVEHASQRLLGQSGTVVKMWRDLVEETVEEPCFTGAHETSNDANNVP